ncbi:MAG: fibronectin type III domain-containing protein [Candidatus Levybacteria bacterium]|nr:fibronectin type III domain-containing protein [Candidatus Levybacteria bacterium]
MKRSLWELRIPTLLVLVFLVIGTFATSYLVQIGINLTGKASIPENPENVRLANIEDTSFTVSYTTQASVLSSVAYGEDASLGNTAVDERDGTKVSQRKTHSIIVKNLEPETTYFFSILSGGKTFLNGNKLFEVTTGKTLQSKPPKRVVKGKVLVQNGQSSEEVIVYLTADNTQMLSSVLNEENEYTFNISKLRTETLASLAGLSDNTPLNILAISESMQSTATILAKNAETIPPITLSQNYDFTASPLSIAPKASFSATPLAGNIGFPSLLASQSASIKPEILTPDEGEQFSDQRPIFRGKTAPGEKVEITIESEPITAEVTADKSGNWSYRPPSALAPGEHLITITTRDKFSIAQKITKSFTVFAAGTQVSQTATPSGELTITPSPTVPISATQAQLPITPTAVPSLSPSPTPTAQPTLIPTAVTTSLPTLPPAGDTSVNIVGLGALTIAGIGIILLLLSRIPSPL